MAKFLGKGWGFPIDKKDGVPRVKRDPDPDGQFAAAEHEESINQAIWIVLSTPLGERVMRPNFGCAIHELVFAPNSPATRGMAEHHVREALLRWEPRIEVLDVRAITSDGPDEELWIGVDYRVRTTDTRFNFVYPFYLDRGAP